MLRHLVMQSIRLSAFHICWQSFLTCITAKAYRPNTLSASIRSMRMKQTNARVNPTLLQMRVPHRGRWQNSNHLFSYRLLVGYH